MTSGPDNPNFDFLDENQEPQEENNQPQDADEQPADADNDFFSFFSDLTPEKDALEENTPVYMFSGEEEDPEPSDENHESAPEPSGVSRRLEAEEEAQPEEEMFFSEDVFSEEAPAEDEPEMMEETDFPEAFPEDAEEEIAAEEFPMEEDIPVEEAAEEDAWGGFSMADADSGEGLPEAVPGGFSFPAAEEEAEPEPELAADDRLVRLPDDEREFYLSELIDVATGEPLDLRSLIPEGVARGAADAGFGLAGGFGGGMAFGDGSAPAFGADAATVGEGVPRKTPIRKTAPKKKKSLAKEIIGVVIGGLISLPIVHVILLCIMGDERNIPGMPTPFFPDTYYHVQEPAWSWMPTWMLPGYDPAVHTSANYKKEQAMQDAVNGMLENVDADASSSPEASVMETDDGEDDADVDNIGADIDGGANETPYDPDFDPMADMDDGMDTDVALSTDGLDIPAGDVADEPENAFVPPAYGDAELKTAIAAGSKAPELMAFAEKMTFFDGDKTGSTWKAAESKFGKIAGAAKALAPLNDAALKAVKEESFDTGVIFSGTVKNVATKNGFQVVTITADGSAAEIAVISQTVDASLKTGVKCVIGGVLVDAAPYPDMQAAAGSATVVWRGPVVVK